MKLIYIFKKIMLQTYWVFCIEPGDKREVRFTESDRKVIKIQKERDNLK